MGHRHLVISGDMVPPKKELPGWFIEKYYMIDLDRDFWAIRKSESSPM